MGLAELLLLAFIVLLLFRGRQLPSLGRRLGEQARKPFRKARWVWGSVAGDEAEALRAEVAFGRECAAEFEAQFPGRPSPDDARRITEVGAQLRATLGEAPHAFEFHPVVDTRPNAFALPGGFVFVSDGLLRLCGDDRSAVAFVLAHEMGHVLRHHARDRVMADVVFDVVGRRLPAAGQVVRQMLGKGYSREQEREADREALRLAEAAGFDPEGGVRALELLARGAPEATGPADYLSTHPRFDERIRTLREALGAAPGETGAR